MIQVNHVTLKFGKRTLFEDVNLKFLPGACYGLIGANGAGKSTFLKLLTKELETTQGEISIGNGERVSFLKQDHYSYDDVRVLDVVLMGNELLWKVIDEKNKLYSQTEFSEDDYMKMADLEAEFQDLDGYNADQDAAFLLSNLGVGVEYHTLLMREIPVKMRVKVLLAGALFQNPDILLLDEPTNGLDMKAIQWLEEFLMDYQNTVIVVSHDRHFLNKVCTHIVDIDFGKMKIYAGNYDFWYQSRELALKQVKEQNRKKEEKMKELQAFIDRFSANASKSKQATSRKKILEKIELEEIVPSSRKYPYIDFKIENKTGNEILEVKNLTKEKDGEKLLSKISFTVQKGDKIALLGENDLAKTTLLNILAGVEKYDKGQVQFGKTIHFSYLPQDNSSYFLKDESILEWLGNYSDSKDLTYLRSFLGRMLFSSDEVFKKTSVLSGGEKVRCMISRAMLSSANFLLLDEPTNHLDLESITSLNKGLKNFQGEMIFTSRDLTLNETLANRIIEIQEDGTILDKRCNFNEYYEWKESRK